MTRPRRPSAPRVVHAIRWKGTRVDHRLSEACPCQPMACFDLAEPARVVFVHRSPPADAEHRRLKAPFVGPTPAATRPVLSANTSISLSQPIFPSHQERYGRPYRPFAGGGALRPHSHPGAALRGSWRVGREKQGGMTRE
jgi:hypothetical protein